MKKTFWKDKVWKVVVLKKNVFSVGGEGRMGFGMYGTKAMYINMKAIISHLIAFRPPYFVVGENMNTFWNVKKCKSKLTKWIHLGACSEAFCANLLECTIAIGPIIPANRLSCIAFDRGGKYCVQWGNCEWRRLSFAWSARGERTSSEKGA